MLLFGRGQRDPSDFDQLEIGFLCPALRTGPCDRHILPPRPRGNPIVGQARSFIINPAANQAHPGSEGGFGAHQIDSQGKNKGKSP